MIQPALSLLLNFDEEVQVPEIEKPRFFAVPQTRVHAERSARPKDDFRPRWWRVEQPEDK